MPHPKSQSVPQFRAAWLVALAATLAPACMSDTHDGLVGPSATPESEAAGAGAGGENASGALDEQGGAHSVGQAGSGGVTQAAGMSPQEGGADGNAEGGFAAVPLAGAGAGGEAAEPAPGVHIPRACVFHTDAPVAPEASAGGEGGVGGEGPGPEVVAQLSPFLGYYLTDAEGRTLYIYTADAAGDCEHPPVSKCEADCLLSWPVFDGRALGPGLDEAAFGSIERPDGAQQTTYFGWPLYYYKADLALGQMAGQAKGKVWWVAEQELPAVLITKSGTLKYLSDTDGHTLYVSAQDQVGTGETAPVSNCVGSCLQTFEGFHVKGLSLVTALEMKDFEVFARGDGGGLQIAYKGMPLYRAATDLKAGDMNGTAIAGFTAAVP